MVKVEIIKPRKSGNKIDPSYDIGLLAMSDIKKDIIAKTESMVCEAHPISDTTVTLSFNVSVTASTNGCCQPFEKMISEAIKA